MKQNDIHKFEQRRDGGIIKEENHDPYRDKKKLAEPTVCPTCKAVFSKARWQWLDQVPEGAQNTECPACRRIAHDYPAGVIIMSGTYLAAHKDEILNLVRNTEAQEKAQHALQRIMKIEDVEGSGLEITFTGLHLPRRVAHALEHAHKGTLDTHYDEAGYFVRIGWHRDL